MHHVKDEMSFGETVKFDSSLLTVTVGSFKSQLLSVQIYPSLPEEVVFLLVSDTPCSVFFSLQCSLAFWM